MSDGTQPDEQIVRASALMVPGMLRQYAEAESVPPTLLTYSADMVEAQAETIIRLSARLEAEVRARHDGHRTWTQDCGCGWIGRGGALQPAPLHAQYAAHVNEAVAEALGAPKTDLPAGQPFGRTEADYRTQPGTTP